MATKIRPNEPCPCGSARKFKKCCGAPDARGGAARGVFTQADRRSALAKLDAFILERWRDEAGEAFVDFWGRHFERGEALPPEMFVMSRDVQETWFAFDRRLEDGTRIVDAYLGAGMATAGERAFLQTMRESMMRLYEVTATVPGSSVTLRDLLDGTAVTVSERSASKTLSRNDWIAARVVARGASGNPEMEAGVLPLANLGRDRVLDAVKELHGELLAEDPVDGAATLKEELPPLFHDAWITAIFEPAIPRLTNTDGEELVITRVTFHVEDEAALSRALDGAEAEREGIRRARDAAWSWVGPSASPSPSPSMASGPATGETSLATLSLRDGVLTVEANSVERGARARALVERIARAAVRHRATTHEDMRRQVMEDLTAHALRRTELDDSAASALPGHHPQTRADAAIDSAVAEALVLDHYARHYRAWVDVPVPALDRRTPRDAAKDRALRERVEELIRGLEGIYERALKDGQPAYDPSWMWGELGLEPEADARELPLLAHERVAERVPGSAEATRAAAERARAAPTFSDSTTVGDETLARDLQLQRFLRRERTSANDAAEEGALAAPYVPLVVNLELHRRKVFWVDAGLSYMLESTDLDAAGTEVRAPFPSLALAFTDRHALSLGERLLARRQGDPLRGQILRVATVYVTEHRDGQRRSISLDFAFDALGADLPSLVHFDVPADDDASLPAFLESVGPGPIVATETVLPDTSPARRLVRLALNAILYATSAGVTPELRPVARRRDTRGSRIPPTASLAGSDSVFFLPGTIDIRQVRQLQEIARAPQGTALLARFMVRGHWRRPPKNWTDQRLRWIEPYWKGPEMAAVIEKAYRLKE